MVSQGIRKTTRIRRQLASGPSKLVAASGSPTESRNGLTMESHARVDVSRSGCDPPPDITSESSRHGSGIFIGFD